MEQPGRQRRNDPSLRWALALSALLHATLGVVLLEGLVQFGGPLALDDAIQVEIVLDDPILPEPEVVQEVPAEPVTGPEPTVVEEISAEPEPEPAVVEEIPPEPVPEPEPEVVEEIPPELVPEPESAVVEEVTPEPEPEVLEEAAPELLPELAVLPTPPMPARKPETAGILPPTAVEPPAEPLPAETLVAEPAAPIAPEATADPPEPSYRHQGEIGAITPEQFLANLTALADENLQAERNPALWEVIRAVRKQVRECWMLDPKNPPSARMTVDMKLNFDQSGRVLKAEIKEIGRMVNDEAYKSFVLDARAALMSCSPFELPADSYGIWRSFTMRFVPINRL